MSNAWRNLALASTAYLTHHLLPTKKTKCSSSENPKILFLGTGSSTGCPKPLCAILFGHHATSSPLHRNNISLYKELYNTCHVSRIAIRGDPAHNKNYRGNPSLLISTGDKNIVIDVGKTFRENALRFLPSNDIHSIDAVVLTHEHMDAIGGLDDLRGFQRLLPSRDGPRQSVTPIYLSRRCFDGIERQFHYLVPKEFGDAEVIRHVAKLEYHTIQPFRRFTVKGVEMTPLPVLHGEDLTSFAYAFSLGDKNVIYISDISRMPRETLEYILKVLPSTHILIVDSLLVDREHPVHYSLRQAIALSKKIGAEKTFIVGMNCDNFLPHEEMNEKLKEEEEVDVQLAHDGLVIHL